MMMHQSAPNIQQFIEQISACLSHELNDPLEEIQQQLAECNGLAAEQMQAWQATLQLVRDRQLVLRDLTYLMQNREPASEVVIQEIVAQAVSECQPLIQAAGAVVECESLPVLLARKRQLVRLFTQLIDNAIRHNTATHPQVTVAAETSDAGTTFIIRDNGAGFEPKYLPLALGLFQHVPGNAATAGLRAGLSLCHCIVANHGGDISCRQDKQIQGFEMLVTMVG